MRYSEDELLPLSALQHLIYCERQAALIHIEQIWVDNVWTVEGSHLHDAIVTGHAETRREVRIARDLALRSLRIGITGRTDVVEFHGAAPMDAVGACIHDWPGRWIPFPVEYKRGRPKRHHADEVQLCAQAICLEEMLDAHVPEGALFYGQTRRRQPVLFDADLRAMTESAALRLHQLVNSRITPKAVYDPDRCDECSLFASCRPRAGERRVDRYMEDALRQTRSDEEI